MIPEQLRIGFGYRLFTDRLVQVPLGPLDIKLQELPALQVAQGMIQPLERVDARESLTDFNEDLVAGW